MDGLADVLSTTDKVQSQPRININKTKVLGAIHNMFKKTNTVMNRYAASEMKGVEQIPKHFSKIRSAEAVEQAQSKHVGVSYFDKNHEVVRDYRRVAKELIQCLG